MWVRRNVNQSRSQSPNVRPSFSELVQCLTDSLTVQKKNHAMRLDWSISVCQKSLLLPETLALLTASVWCQTELQWVSPVSDWQSDRAEKKSCNEIGLIHFSLSEIIVASRNFGFAYCKCVLSIHFGLLPIAFLFVFDIKLLLVLLYYIVINILYYYGLTQSFQWLV